MQIVKTHTIKLQASVFFSLFFIVFIGVFCCTSITPWRTISLHICKRKKKVLQLSQYKIFRSLVRLCATDLT